MLVEPVKRLEDVTPQEMVTIENVFFILIESAVENVFGKEDHLSFNEWFDIHITERIVRYNILMEHTSPEECIPLSKFDHDALVEVYKDLCLSIYKGELHYPLDRMEWAICKISTIMREFLFKETLVELVKSSEN